MDPAPKRMKLENDSDKNRSKIVSLHDTIKIGSIGIVKFCIEKGADVSELDSDGLTTIHLAFKIGDKEILSLLVSADESYKVEKNPTDKRGFSHFHAACMVNNIGAVTHFLANEVDVNAALHSGESKLDLHNRFCGYTPLHFAVENKNPRIVEMLIDHDAYFNAKDAKGRTPLHLACMNFDEEIMWTLVQSGANVEAVSQLGKRPLHCAAEYGNARAVEVLLFSAVDVHAKDTEGKLAWQYEYLRDNRDLFHLYLTILDDHDHRNEDGATLLDDIIKKYGVNHMKILVDMHPKNGEGSTILHTAAKSVFPSLMDLALQYGADSSVQNNRGQTALHALASAEIHTVMDKESKVQIFRRMVHSLVKFGCDLEAKDSEGKTALHIASIGRKENVIIALLENGADINATDNAGNTSITSFLTDGQLETCDISNLLLDHMLKLMNIGFFLNEKNRDLLLCHYKQNELAKQLVQERERMREARVTQQQYEDGRVPSYYDVLFKSNQEMVSIIDKNDFMDNVRSDAFDELFPSYAYLIKLKVREGVVRKNCLLVSEFFVSLRWPDTFSRKILKCLAPGHIETLIKALHDDIVLYP